MYGNEVRKKFLKSYLGASLSERKSKPPPPSIIIAKQTFLVRTEKQHEYRDK